jgi:hypothetical protein
MKHCFRTRHQHIAACIILFVAMFFLFLAGTSADDSKKGPGDEVISLILRDEPLGDALKKISTATGYEFDVDERWQNYPVTASLEAVSLHKGLKSILKNTNNVIIYGPDRKIKIVIYDKTKSGEVSARRSSEESFDKIPAPRRRANDKAVLKKRHKEREAEALSESKDESVAEPETDASDKQEEIEPEKPGKESDGAGNTDETGASEEGNPRTD